MLPREKIPRSMAGRPAAPTSTSVSSLGTDAGYGSRSETFSSNPGGNPTLRIVPTDDARDARTLDQGLLRERKSGASSRATTGRQGR